MVHEVCQRCFYSVVHVNLCYYWVMTGLYAVQIQALCLTEVACIESPSLYGFPVSVLYFIYLFFNLLFYSPDFYPCSSFRQEQFWVRAFDGNLIPPLDVLFFYWRWTLQVPSPLCR